MGVIADIRARAQSLWHSGGRAATVVRAGAAGALVCAAFATVAASARSEPATPFPFAASGAFSTWNSLGGQPILTASEMGFGDEVEGDVKIKNMGDTNGRFTLLKHALVDQGGRSAWLHVRVHDITPPGPPVPVYEGSLAAMPAATQLAREFAPNEQRHYRFKVKFDPPSPPAGGHPVATTSVAFEWGADPVAPATPPPSPPPAPAPAPAAPAPARAPSKAKACVKKASAKKMSAAAKKRAVAACKKKPAKKPVKKPVKRK